MKRNNSMIAAFTLPAAILFVAIFVYPVIRTVFMSFFSIQEITDSFSSWVFNGFGNYKALMNNQLYLTSWSNLFKIFFVGGAITLGFSLLMAAILKSGVKFKGFWQAVIYMPNIVSAVAMATMWNQYVFNSTYGFLHNFFDALGLETLAKIQWLSPDMKFTALLVSYCFGTIGHYMLIWLSGMERISPDIYEAAGIDGCHPIRTFWQIVFPMAQGGMITVTIFNFINIWNEYFLSLLFVNSESLRPVALGLFSMINGMQYSGDWSGLFASVMIVFAPTFFIYVFLSKYIIGGLTGGVKG